MTRYFNDIVHICGNLVMIRFYEDHWLMRCDSCPCFYTSTAINVAIKLSSL